MPHYLIYFYDSVLTPDVKLNGILIVIGSYNQSQTLLRLNA